ncbi:MAG: hypothetical protein H0T59_09320 [Chloroflexi bacterium]|nr:hypothetical protein [Chloroflexota bacterium]
MIDIPVEDFVFVVCALIGGGLLLITVLLDDVLGAVFHFDVGGVSLMPLLLSFIAMFGVGGLFATQVLDVHAGQAAVVGSVFGVAGMGIGGPRPLRSMCADLARAARSALRPAHDRRADRPLRRRVAANRVSCP